MVLLDFGQESFEITGGELRKAGGDGKEYAGHLKLLVSEHPPRVPSLVRKGQEGLVDFDRVS